MIDYLQFKVLEAEYRRLKELNREMVEALQLIANHKGVAGFEDDGRISYMPVMPKEIQIIARKALNGNWFSRGKVLIDSAGKENE